MLDFSAWGQYCAWETRDIYIKYLATVTLKLPRTTHISGGPVLPFRALTLIRETWLYVTTVT